MRNVKYILFSSSKWTSIVKTSILSFLDSSMLSCKIILTLCFSCFRLGEGVMHARIFCQCQKSIVASFDSIFFKRQIVLIWLLSFIFKLQNQLVRLFSTFTVTVPLVLPTRKCIVWSKCLITCEGFLSTLSKYLFPFKCSLA